MPKPADDLISPRELARAFGVCTKTAAAWMDRGLLRHHRGSGAGRPRGLGRRWAALADAAAFAAAHGLPTDGLAALARRRGLALPDTSTPTGASQP